MNKTLASLLGFMLLLKSTWTAYVAQSGTSEPKRNVPEPSLQNSIGMKLVLIPKGKYTMGSPKEEAVYNLDERPQHDVTITESFYLGVYEVTQEQLREVMGYNPSCFSRKASGKKGITYDILYEPGGCVKRVPSDDDTEVYPVENVSWEEANEFCEKLNQTDKKKPTGWTYRLPTEAEWEYSARGSAVPEAKHQRHHFGNSIDTSLANFGGICKNSPLVPGVLDRTCKVGSYKPNAFGLYDMHGNVGEWCLDWYGEDYYDKSPAADPKGPTEHDKSGAYRVKRGGDHTRLGGDCRSASRSASTGRDYGTGFRVALVPDRK